MAAPRLCKFLSDLCRQLYSYEGTLPMLVISAGESAYTQEKAAAQVVQKLA